MPTGRRLTSCHAAWEITGYVSLFGKERKQFYFSAAASNCPAWLEQKKESWSKKKTTVVWSRLWTVHKETFWIWTCIIIWMKFLLPLSHHDVLFRVETEPVELLRKITISKPFQQLLRKNTDVLLMFLCLCDLLLLNLLNLLHFPHFSEGWVASAIVAITA